MKYVRIFDLILMPLSVKYEMKKYLKISTVTFMTVRYANWYIQHRWFEKQQSL